MTPPNQKWTHSSTYQYKLPNILEYYPNHLYTFTDAYKNNDKTACAANLNEAIIRKYLPNKSYFYPAETRATALSLNIITENNHKENYPFSNSISVFLSLRKKKLVDPPTSLNSWV